MIFLLVLALVKTRGKIPNNIVFSGLGLYVLAKIFEGIDKPVFATNGFVSGHTLKHLVAGLALMRLMSFMNQTLLRN
jgi:hypothetical protein